MNSNKKFMIFCEFCNWKKISDLKESGLYELKNDTLSNKKYRCKNCGRAVAPRPFKDLQIDIDKNNEEIKIKQENEVWAKEIQEFQKDFMKGKEDDE